MNLVIYRWLNVSTIVRRFGKTHGTNKKFVEAEFDEECLLSRKCLGSDSRVLSTRLGDDASAIKRKREEGTSIPDTSWRDVMRRDATRRRGVEMPRDEMAAPFGYFMSLLVLLLCISGSRHAGITNQEFCKY